MSMHVRPRALGVLAALLAAACCAAPAHAADPTLRPAGADALVYTDAGASGTTRDVDGTLVPIVEEAAGERRRYAIERADGRLVPVAFGVELPDGTTDAAVSAAVTRDGDVARARVQETTARAGVTPRAHRYYVAKVTNRGAFTDRFGAAQTDAAIEGLVLRAAERWVEEGDGAIASFTPGSAMRPVSVGASRDCASSDYGVGAWNDAAAAFPGVNFGRDSGNHLIVVSPRSCGGGIGTVGASVASGGRLAFDFDPAMGLQVVMHEIGHNLSLDHQNACYRPVPYTAGAACASVEYGNFYSFMGASISSSSPFTAPTLDSFERTRLGIADAGEVRTVALPAGGTALTETVDLTARGSFAGTRGLRIADPSGAGDLYVDWRSGTGRDLGAFYALMPWGFSGRDYGAGVTVEWVPKGETSSWLMGHAQADPADGDELAYVAGQSYTTADGAIRVAVDAVGDPAQPGATSRVTVALGAGVAAPGPSPVVGTPGTGVATAPAPGTGTSPPAVPATGTGTALAPPGRPGATPQAVFTARPTVRIRGRAVVGRTLRAVSSGAFAPRPDARAFRWYADGRRIRGALRPTLRVTRALRGKRLAVAVLADRAGLSRARVASARTARVRG